MINRTRITVDAATRDVLDQLTTELARPPSWISQLSDDLRQFVEDAFRDSRANQDRGLAPIVTSTRALQVQIGQQTQLISGLHEPVDTLNQRFEQQVQSIDHLSQNLARLTELAVQGSNALAAQRQAIDEATRKVLDQLSTEFAKRPAWVLQLSGDVKGVVEDAFRDSQVSQEKGLSSIAASTRVLQNQIEQQADSLAAVDGRMQTVLTEVASLQSVSTSQAELIAGLYKPLSSFNERLEQQASGQADLAGIVQLLGTMIREIRSEQLVQGDALQRLGVAIDRLNRPWWQRFFFSSKSSKP